MALRCFGVFVQGWMHDSLRLEWRLEAHFWSASRCLVIARAQVAALGTSFLERLFQDNAGELNKIFEACELYSFHLGLAKEVLQERRAYWRDVARWAGASKAFAQMARALTQNLLW